MFWKDRKYNSKMFYLSTIQEPRTWKILTFIFVNLAETMQPHQGPEYGRLTPYLLNQSVCGKLVPSLPSNPWTSPLDILLNSSVATLLNICCKMKVLCLIFVSIGHCTHAHTHTHARTHARTHTHTHALTHTHTHVEWPWVAQGKLRPPWDRLQCETVCGSFNIRAVFVM